MQKDGSTAKAEMGLRWMEDKSKGGTCGWIDPVMLEVSLPLDFSVLQQTNCLFLFLLKTV